MITGARTAASTAALEKVDAAFRRHHGGGGLSGLGGEAQQQVGVALLPEGRDDDARLDTASQRQFRLPVAVLVHAGGEQPTNVDA